MHQNNLCRISDLTLSQKKTCADLTYDILPDFYQTLSADKHKLLTIISEQFSQKKTDLGPSIALLQDKKPIGLYTLYPIEELHKRTLYTLLSFALNCPKSDNSHTNQALKALAGDIPIILGEGMYLARFGIVTHKRKQGYAQQLWQQILQRITDTPCWLHVKADNKTAIAFYKKNGFKVKNQEKAFWIMKRD